MNAHQSGTHRIAGRIALVLVVALTPALRAQQPVSPAQPSPPSTVVQFPGYRPPAFALVQPAAGGSVPQDRPIVVFRFAGGEPNDPVDIRSYAIVVDGQDRTSLFQVSAVEAWGPLAPFAEEVTALDAGPHQLAARICSSRGACAELAATVSVVTSGVDDGHAQQPRSVRRRKLLGALLDAVKKILAP